MRIWVVAFSALMLGCNRQSNVITEKDPFQTILVRTPDTKDKILLRCRKYAEMNGFEILYAGDHFEPREYSLSLIRDDLNIVANNVGKGEFTVVRAYSREKPTSSQKTLVGDYQCFVMKSNCKVGSR